MPSSKHSSSQVPQRHKSRASIGQSIVFLLLLGLCFNIVVKEQSAIVTFFEVIDTITKMVMGSIVTVLMGLGIVSVFTITKLYTNHLKPVPFESSKILF